jgi:hypothetical protein
MIRPLPRPSLVLALLLALAACNQNPAQDQTPKAPTPASAPAAEAPPPPAAQASATAPAPIPPSTEVQVDRVSSVMVSRAEDKPDAVIVRAAGTVASAGWTEPKLIAVEDANGATNLRIYSFVATSPQMPSDAKAPTPVETELRIEGLPPDVRTIRVTSATNAISAPIVQ